MSAARQMDPALKRMLATLPAGSPDVGIEDIDAQPERIELQVPFCKGVHVVPPRTRRTLTFGPWFGPTQPVTGVIIVARNLKTGNSRQWRINHTKGPNVATPGMFFNIDWQGEEV